MKKIISILMILCICFAICACKGGETSSGTDNTSTPNSSLGQSSDENKKPSSSSKVEESSSKVEESSKTSEPDRETITAFAPARKFSTKAVSQKRTLNNTAYKLNNNKKLNVLYYGGSVTAGVGGTAGNSWASRTEKWLKSTYPRAQINCTNKAVSGSCVYFGNFRADLDVIPYAPDLMFIEFAVNDSYEDLYYAQSAYYLEMLIKRVNTKFPQTDIIILLITDKGKVGEKFENNAAHKAVAEHYGIPCIDLGAELAKLVNSGAGKWEDYLSDYVHPNDKGYEMYANFITEKLKTMLAIDAKALKNHVMPEESYIVGGINMDCKTVTADKVKLNDGWKLENSNCKSYTTCISPKKQGSKITIEFEGTSFGMYLTTAKGNTVVATVDGKERKIFIKPDDEGEHERLVFDNLIKGKHKVEIESVSSGDVNIYAFFIG